MTGYPPVVGWSARNTSGCPSGGTWTARAPAPRWAARRSTARPSATPDEPQRHPVGVGGDRPGRLGEATYAAVDPVRARPGRHAQHPVGPRPPRRVSRAEADGRADGQHVAVGERRRSEPGQRVGRPGAEHRLDVEAARHRDVAAHPGPRRPDPQLGAGRDGHRLAPGHGPPVDGHLRDGSGHRDRDRLVGAHRHAAERGLQQGGTRLVAGQPVGQPRGRPVQEAGPRHAEVREAGAAGVLHGGQRAGVEDRQGAGHQASTNRTRVPGVSSAGSSRVDVPQHGVGAAEQPPAAGRRGRVDPGVLPRQSHRPGRHPRPRAVQPGYGQLGGSPVQ